MLVVSLSTVPPRFCEVGTTLRSILAQTVRPDRVILYVPRSYRRFPGHAGGLPEVPEGVEIRQTDSDPGPATKVLFAAREFAADEAAGRPVDILFCDDDIHYEPDWIAGFVAARRERPEGALAAQAFHLTRLGLAVPRDASRPRMVPMPRWMDLRYRSKRIYQQLVHHRLNPDRQNKPSRRQVLRAGHADIFEGLAGVMVRPSFFDHVAWEIPEVIWSVDDVWLSGMLARRGIGIWAFARGSRYRLTAQHRVEPLYRSIIEGTGRDRANRLCADYLRDRFGIWGGTGGASASLPLPQD